MSSGEEDGVQPPQAPPTQPWGVTLPSVAVVGRRPGAQPHPEPHPGPHLSPHPGPPPPPTPPWGVPLSVLPIDAQFRPGLPGPPGTFDLALAAARASVPPSRTASRRSHRRLAVVGAAAALCLGAGAVGAGVVPISGLLPTASQTRVQPTAGTPPSADPASVRAAGVASVVRQMDSALRSNDEAAFVALVEPTGGALATRLRGMIRGAKRVGLTSLSLAVTPNDVSAGAPRAGYDRTANASVAMRYSLKPWDPTAVTTVLGLTFAQRGAQWALVDDSADAASLPLGGPYEPWLVGDVGVARRAHVLVVGDPGRAADNERLAGLLEKAVAAVRGVVTTSRWNGRVVAYASTDPRFVASWFGTQAATGSRISGKEPATFAAEVRTLPTNPVTSRSDTLVPATARIAVTPYLLSRGDTRTRAVLRHEITHVALALEGQGAVPTWLVEGAAEYSAYRALAAGQGKRAVVNGVSSLDQRGLPNVTWQQLRRGTWKPVLSQTPATFYRGTTAQVADAYTTAWLTCLYIASHYGEAALFTLYGTAARQPSAQDAATVEQAILHEVLGTDRATLLRETTAYARTLRSNFA